MTTSEILLANRTLAVLARLHRVGHFQTVWATDVDQKYKLTVETKERSVSILIDIHSMREGFRGDEEVQANIIRQLSGLIRSLVDQCGLEQHGSARVA